MKNLLTILLLASLASADEITIQRSSMTPKEKRAHRALAENLLAEQGAQQRAEAIAARIAAVTSEIAALEADIYPSLPDILSASPATVTGSALAQDEETGQIVSLTLQPGDVVLTPGGLTPKERRGMKSLKLGLLRLDALRARAISLAADQVRFDARLANIRSGVFPSLPDLFGDVAGWTVSDAELTRGPQGGVTGLRVVGTP
jgi:hypothetical protein